MKRHIFLAAALLPLTLAECVKDPTSVEPVIPVPSARGVYILNEGLFGRANSTLSYFDLGSFQVYNDVFAGVNSRSIGDVGNQIVLRGSTGYIVVNNSDKIEVLDVTTNRSTGTILLPSGSSPRQMAFVNDTIGLVTNLYDGSVSLVDLPRRAVMKRIPVGDNPEGIVVTQGKAYVANSGLGTGTTVSVVSLSSYSTVVTITIGDNPVGVCLAPSGLVCVVCAGFYEDFSDPSDDTPARIKFIDPSRDLLVDSITVGGHATTMAINNEGYAYVPTTDSVLTVDTRSRRIIGGFVRGNYYGVGVEVVSGDVYLSDVRNYIQPGTVSVFAPNGQLRTEFTVGLVPGTFAFKR